MYFYNNITYKEFINRIIEKRGQTSKKFVQLYKTKIIHNKKGE